MRKIKTGKPLSERESESLTTYLDEIGRAKLLTEEEERELSEKIKAGDARALDRLTTANLKLVVSIAKHYQDRGVGMNDLVSEGNIGLMKAARNYDGSRGTRFANYAKAYIKESIEAAINEQSGIYRLPKGETNAQTKEQSKAFSVDAPLEEGKHMSLLSVLSDPSAPLPDKLALEKSIKDELVDAMDVLNYRERIIIESFYGIDQPHRTFAEIGEQMGLKRERVRQIRNTAVRKLRKNTTSDMLKAYLA